MNTVARRPESLRWTSACRSFGAPRALAAGSAGNRRGAGARPARTPGSARGRERAAPRARRPRQGGLTILAAALHGARDAVGEKTPNARPSTPGASAASAPRARQASSSNPVHSTVACPCSRLMPRRYGAVRDVWRAFATGSHRRARLPGTPKARTAGNSGRTDRRDLPGTDRRALPASVEVSRVFVL